MSIALMTVVLLNAIWFGMAFQAFYIRRRVFGKVMVPIPVDRENTAYEALVESGRFMGGFNLTLSVLNIALAFNLANFDTDRQWAMLLAFNAIAHASQFAGNIPMAVRNFNGSGLWNVFTGVMLRIFVIDFILMVFNAALAVMLLV